MASCLAGVAVTLMALKLFVWLTIARPFASAPLNGVFAVAASLMLWTYARAACADAGPVHFALDGRVRSAEEGGDELEELKAEQGYCERCDRPKPARVHHCSTCRCCVYRMDHHCPWTSNCVGWSNKKYFLLFLLYTSVSCLTFCAIVTPLVFSTDPGLKRVRHAHKTLLQLGWTLSLAIGLVLAGYLMFHIYLLRQGKTTLEYITGKPGEFERVPFWRHVRVYFGGNVLLWLLPVAPRLDARIRGRRHERESRQLMI